MRTLVLWDIDGTLIRGGAAATGAFNRALREVYELTGEPARIEYGGKTDGQIALEVLGLHDVAEMAALERLDHFQARYIRLVHEAYEELCTGVQVLPGVREVIRNLAGNGTIQSVLTGNLAATAELKLRAAGLSHLLDLEIGAFGSDHRNRDVLVPIARAKAAARSGEAARVVVIGDTPRDIACGKAGGARTVAVATGNWRLHELSAHAPDALLPDLSDVAVAVDAILGSELSSSRNVG